MPAPPKSFIPFASQGGVYIGVQDGGYVVWTGEAERARIDEQGVGFGNFASSDELRARAEGLVAQVCPREYLTATGGTGSGTTRFGSIWLRRGMALTNVWLAIQTAGAGLTLAKVGVWRTDGTLMAATADMSAALMLAAPAMRSAPLATPWTVPADGLYYVGILQVGTTPAAIAMSASLASASSNAPAGVWTYSALTSQADLATFNPASLTSSSLCPWIGFN